MEEINKLVTDNIDLWTSTIQSKSGVGRGSSKKQTLYGIKKLRELILELAVRGKLVPQDENDEPAYVLLEKVASENERLIKEKKIKNKKISTIATEEKPFDLPSGWEWTRIQNIGHDWGQKSPNQDFSYIDVSSINKELGFIENPNILSSKEAPSRARKIIKKGSIIYSTVRPYLLNIAIVDQDIIPEPIASTAFAIIHPYTGISASFVYRYFRSPSFIKYVESCQNGIAYPAINDKQFFSGLIPIPPNNEQYRIVQKVDELMALCDQLEKQTENSLTAHQTLVENLLDTLTQSQNSDDLAENWNRISDHFDILFTTEKSIDSLKQTILQLAVMGKLVPQDLNDEPASILLEKIAAEKDRLVKEKKIKKQKALPEVGEDEIFFDLPVGWVWKRLNDLFLIITDGDHQAPPKRKEGIPFLVIGNLNTGRILLNECRFVDENYYNSLDWIRKPILRDILYTVTGSYGIPIIVDIPDRFCVQRHVSILKSASSSPVNYTKIFLSSKQSKTYADNVATGIAQKTVPLSSLRLLPVAVPPINEQKRIIQKVDQLMALCEKLKSNISCAEETQLNLTNAIVEKAVG